MGGRGLFNLSSLRVVHCGGAPLSLDLMKRFTASFPGYIGDQEATSLILDSEGWLRTGDLCYFDEDGFLFVVDRLKELIKYKGYQVPPAELESLLQTQPDIIEAAVVPRVKLQVSY
ncbi:hypothetical protein C4D60_Mb06t21450 [Musa balbisiana]|uniref:Uncharacterized protein n=1 Tax=Musa balbisiana TaxID=52838 RepID=A0A4S8IS63_MUSBA|nr:hypothetical protein C4D60_Mb06t21450 [Musa balbisiana]